MRQEQQSDRNPRQRRGEPPREDPLRFAQPRLRQYLAECRYSGQPIALDAYGKVARMLDEFLGTRAGLDSGFVAQDDRQHGVIWLVMRGTHVE